MLAATFLIGLVAISGVLGQTDPAETTQSTTVPTSATETPSTQPTTVPTSATETPSTQPTTVPTSATETPSTQPTTVPTSATETPSTQPTTVPTSATETPSTQPTTVPTSATETPSSQSTTVPTSGTETPSTQPTTVPTSGTETPSTQSTTVPTSGTETPPTQPTTVPTSGTETPSTQPTTVPTSGPTTENPSDYMISQASIWWNDRFIISGAIIDNDFVLTDKTRLESVATKVSVALGTPKLADHGDLHVIDTVVIHENTSLVLLRSTLQPPFEDKSIITMRSDDLGANPKCFVVGWLESDHDYTQYPVIPVSADDCKADHTGEWADGTICMKRTDNGNNCGVVGMSLICDGKLTGVLSSNAVDCATKPTKFTELKKWRSWAQGQMDRAHGGASQMTPLATALTAVLLLYKTIV